MIVEKQQEVPELDTLMIVSVSRVGLAQFMIMNGARLKKFDHLTQVFKFESNITGKEWRLAYAKSRFPEFDAGVRELLNLKKGKD